MMGIHPPVGGAGQDLIHAIPVQVGQAHHVDSAISSLNRDGRCSLLKKVDLPIKGTSHNVEPPVAIHMAKVSRGDRSAGGEGLAQAPREFLPDAVTEEPEFAIGSYDQFADAIAVQIAEGGRCLCPTTEEAHLLDDPVTLAQDKGAKVVLDEDGR